MTTPLNTFAISACWYAYGYNDHRPAGAPYIDPEQFARYFLALDAQGSRPSIQDAFRAFRDEVENGDVSMMCDTCGTHGTADDGIELGGECAHDWCHGTIVVRV